jgi:HK97 family phage portal protein
MNEDLQRMKGMRGLRANIPVKTAEQVQQKQAVDFDNPAFLEMLMGTTPQHISPEKAMRISAVYSCLKVLSETIMTLPCNLQKVTGDSSETLHADSLHRLFAYKPNDLMTAAEFWAFQVIAICLEGNAYNYIVRTSSGKIVGVLPIRYSEASVDVLQPGNRVRYRFSVEGKPLFLGPEEVLHFKSPMSTDGIVGLSPLQYNATLLNGAANARDFSNKVLTNNATPRGVLTTDGDLSDEAYANIKESWNAAHGGVDNSSRVAILEAGLKFNPISMSPEDLQLLDSQQLSRTEIAGIFRVPPHMIGNLERSTFNNIAHQTLDFYKSSIAPWLRLFEQRLSLAFLGDTTRQFKFDVNEYIRGDFESEVTSYEKLIAGGVLSPNEVRKKLGFNPRSGGDEYVSVNTPTQTQEQEQSPDGSDSQSV